MCRKIIIVGNAPYDKETDTFGTFIDNSGYPVLRFNNFPTDITHAPFVGTRADIWCCIVNRWCGLQNRDDQFKEIWPVLPKPTLDRPDYFLPLFQGQLDKTQWILHEEYNKAAKDIGTTNPSTGIIAVWKALERWNHVYICGFNGFKRDEHGSFHYYPNTTDVPVLAVHNAQVETAYLRFLQKHGTVTMLGPEYAKTTSYDCL